MEILTQIRWKPQVIPNYTGLVEIPAGAIDPYENVFEAIKREVREECGLTVTKFINSQEYPLQKSRENNTAFAFQPFICQQSISTLDGLPWVGFVFLCEVEGELKMEMREAKDPKWLSLEELTDLVENHPEQVFSLQLPVLKYYLDWVKLSDFLLNV